MNDRNEFMIAYGKLCTRMHSILQSKNRDYATAENPFANFEMSTFVGVRPERGILVRIMDKISRVNQLLDKEPDVVDEKVDDTLLDAANYLLILALYLRKDVSNEKVS